MQTDKIVHVATWFLSICIHKYIDICGRLLEQVAIGRIVCLINYVITESLIEFPTCSKRTAEEKIRIMCSAKSLILQCFCELHCVFRFHNIKFQYKNNSLKHGVRNEVTLLELKKIICMLVEWRRYQCDLEWPGYSPVASFFKCDFSYVQLCSSWGQPIWSVARSLCDSWSIFLQ